MTLPRVQCAPVIICSPPHTPPSPPPGGEELHDIKDLVGGNWEAGFGCAVAATVFQVIAFALYFAPAPAPVVTSEAKEPSNV